MARRSRPIQGYPHTDDMAKADRFCFREGHGSLREYLLRWRAEHPLATLNELADEFQIDRGTLNDWLDKLRIGRGGVMFIDLDAEPEAARTGTEG